MWPAIGHLNGSLDFVSELLIFFENGFKYKELKIISGFEKDGLVC